MTYIQLRKMEKEKAMKKNKYSEELSKLRVVFEELKFTSERQMQKYVLCKYSLKFGNTIIEGKLNTMLISCDIFLE